MLQINGCGISPIDSYAYCNAGTESTTNTGDEPVLIRVGSQHADPSDASFSYVATMPSYVATTPNSPNSGAFDEHGNFHIYYIPARGNKLLVLSGGNRPDNLTPTSAADDSSLSDLSGLTPINLSPYGSVNTGDVATKKINGEVTSGVNLEREWTLT